MAYQGFGDGIAEDGQVVRRFAEAGGPLFVSNSFSKSFSLYGERVGALSIAAASAEEAARVLSQLKRVVRTNYSNPPIHGGQVVATVLARPNCASCGKTNWPRCACASAKCASCWSPAEGKGARP
jgi:aromatic-amino-acid transaminase